MIRIQVIPSSSREELEQNLASQAAFGWLFHQETVKKTVDEKLYIWTLINPWVPDHTGEYAQSTIEAAKAHFQHKMKEIGLGKSEAAMEHFWAGVEAGRKAVAEHKEAVAGATRIAHGG